MFNHTSKCQFVVLLCHIKELYNKLWYVCSDAYNIYEHVNGVHRKFYGNGDYDKNFPYLSKSEKLSSFTENFLRITNLQVTESGFNLFCPLVSLAHVLASDSLKIDTTGVVKWLKLYVILYEVNVFVFVYSWLFICHL